MIEFEQFVVSLGPYAKRFTREQLEQLHLEVRKLAQVLLASYQARHKSGRKEVAERVLLDKPGTDRTIRSA